MIESDFSALQGDAFWQEMNRNQWVHPVDEQGQRLSYVEIPKDVAEMRDDPYRSLAGYVRYAGGYEKTPSPFGKPRVRLPSFNGLIFFAIGLRLVERGTISR